MIQFLKINLSLALYMYAHSIGSVFLENPE